MDEYLHDEIPSFPPSPVSSVPPLAPVVDAIPTVHVFPRQDTAFKGEPYREAPMCLRLCNVGFPRARNGGGGDDGALTVNRNLRIGCLIGKGGLNESTW